MMASWPFRSCGNPWLYTHPGQIVRNPLCRSIGKDLLTVHHKLKAILNGTLIAGKQETTLDVVILPGLPHRSIRNTASHHQVLRVIADPNARVGLADMGREWAISLVVGIFVVPVVQIAVKGGAFKRIFLHRGTCEVDLVRVQMDRYTGLSLLLTVLPASNQARFKLILSKSELTCLVLTVPAGMMVRSWRWKACNSKRWHTGETSARPGPSCEGQSNYRSWPRRAPTTSCCHHRTRDC